MTRDGVSGGFNGWANRETHAVSVHIGNDEGAYNSVTEQAAQCVTAALDSTYQDSSADDIRMAATESLAQYLESEYGTVPDGIPPMLSDLLTATLGGVDWEEIATDYVKNVDLFAAGWNLPGYMPDNPAMLFTSFEDARDAIAEELHRNANDAGGLDVNGVNWEEAEDQAYQQSAPFSGQYGAFVYWVATV